VQRQQPVQPVRLQQQEQPVQPVRLQQQEQPVQPVRLQQQEQVQQAQQLLLFCRKRSWKQPTEQPGERNISFDFPLLRI